MIQKELIPSVECKRCKQMHRPDDPMCPHCGFPLPDTRSADDKSETSPSKSNAPVNRPN